MQTLLCHNARGSAPPGAARHAVSGCERWPGRQDGGWAGKCQAMLASVRKIRVGVASPVRCSSWQPPLLCLLELLGGEPQCTAVFSHCTYDMLRDTIGDLGADL